MFHLGAAQGTSPAFAALPAVVKLLRDPHKRFLSIPHPKGRRGALPGNREVTWTWV